MCMYLLPETTSLSSLIFSAASPLLLAFQVFTHLCLQFPLHQGSHSCLHPGCRLPFSFLLFFVVLFTICLAAYFVMVCLSLVSHPPLTCVACEDRDLVSFVYCVPMHSTHWMNGQIYSTLFIQQLLCTDGITEHIQASSMASFIKLKRLMLNKTMSIISIYRKALLILGLHPLECSSVLLLVCCRSEGSGPPWPGWVCLMGGSGMSSEGLEKRGSGPHLPLGLRPWLSLLVAEEAPLLSLQPQFLVVPHWGNNLVYSFSAVSLSSMQLIILIIFSPLKPEGILGCLHGFFLFAHLTGASTS